MGLVSVIVAKAVAPSRSQWVSAIATLSYSLVIIITTFFSQNDFPIGKLTLLSFVLVPTLIGCVLGSSVGWFLKPAGGPTENNPE
jgi:hypothetical protein